MPSFFIERTDTDVILHNKYGVYSRNELLSQLQEGCLTVEELSQAYRLKEFQINHVINALGITYRNRLNDTRVLSADITPSMHQVLIGTLLGDAYMTEPRSYKTAHSINQMDYLYKNAEMLGCFVSTVSYVDGDNGESVNLRTHDHPVFEPYFERFYSKGKHQKFFSEESAHDLEAEGLAYWYMDDGKHNDYGAYLCTGVATLGEVGILIKMLYNTFGIVSTFQVHDTKKGYHNIYVKAESRSKFFELINPYIIPSMRYKVEGKPYPRVYSKTDIVERHLAYCDVVKMPVRFSGDEGVQNSIEAGYRVSDPKRDYIHKIRDAMDYGKQVSKTMPRKAPSEGEIRALFDKGMTDSDIGRVLGFGRNRIADIRKSLGIPRKSQREAKDYEEVIKFPCMSVKLVPAGKIKSNDYNPNVVCEPEMKLLIQSIEQDGLTQPVVVFYDHECDTYVVVDGFHRYKILKEHFKCTRIPVTVIDKPMNDRMASTIRHNRARGKHQVDLMGVLVDKLYKQGWSDEQIADHLGMEGEELLRLRQQVGCAKFLANTEYGKSWEMAE